MNTAEFIHMLEVNDPQGTRTVVLLVTNEDDEILEFKGVSACLMTLKNNYQTSKGDEDVLRVIIQLED